MLVLLIVIYILLLLFVFLRGVLFFAGKCETEEVNLEDGNGKNGKFKILLHLFHGGFLQDGVPHVEVRQHSREALVSLEPSAQRVLLLS